MGFENSSILEKSKKSEQIFINKKIQARAVESDLKMVKQTIKLLSEGGVSAVTLEAVGVNAGCWSECRI